jgi:hypothetical protein
LERRVASLTWANASLWSGASTIRPVVEKAAPEEVDDFREWIRMASQRAALAAKEGGFLGIGGVRVSEREQQVLETLGEIFGVPRGSPPGS